VSSEEPEVQGATSGGDGRPPILIAYDGSELAQTAIRHTAELFADRAILVATVWEPGLASLTVGQFDTFGYDRLPPDPDTVKTVDAAEREHATSVARHGAELARSLGLAAQPLALPDEADVADTLIRGADEASAAAVVLGSHGRSGLRARLMGSVARKLLAHCTRPVVLVRDEENGSGPAGAGRPDSG
jgi:nucleotide-binding universal stress UspA family protein